MSLFIRRIQYLNSQHIFLYIDILNLLLQLSLQQPKDVSVVALFGLLDFVNQALDKLKIGYGAHVNSESLGFLPTINHVVDFKLNFDRFKCFLIFI
jgi:hypothetical protein